MKEKKKKGKSSKNGMFQKWNGYWNSGLKHTKGKKAGKLSIGKAAVKGLSGVATASAGSGFGALLGSLSPWIGGGLLIFGQLIPDKSRLISILGAGMMSWGIARAVQNRAAEDANTVNGLGSLSGTKERLLDFKDNFLTAFYLDKLTKKKTDESDQSDPTMGSVDLSQLDAFEDLTKQSAYNFEMKRELEKEFSEEDESEDEEEFEEEFEDDPVIIDTQEDEFEEEDLEGLNFTTYEEEVDFATM